MSIEVGINVKELFLLRKCLPLVRHCVGRVFFPCFMQLENYVLHFEERMDH